MTKDDAAVLVKLRDTGQTTTDRGQGEGKDKQPRDLPGHRSDDLDGVE